MSSDGNVVQQEEFETYRSHGIPTGIAWEDFFEDYSHGAMINGAIEWLHFNSTNVELVRRIPPLDELPLFSVREQLKASQICPLVRPLDV